MNLCNLLVFSEKLLTKEYFKMFGGKFQKRLAGRKKWQRRGASFLVDRIPYGKFRFSTNRITDSEAVGSGL